MKVKELIKELEKMPQDALVFVIWDGEPRTEINVVWKAKNGAVMTADFNDVCYSDDARPKGAPTPKKEPYWRTPSVFKSLKINITTVGDLPHLTITPDEEGTTWTDKDGIKFGSLKEAVDFKHKNPKT
jgi:hypothetical protein